MSRDVKQINPKFIEYYTELKEKVGDKELLYFVESVHPQHQTNLTYGWILKGEQKLIPTTGRQRRLNFAGGICLNGHRIVYQRAGKVDADNIAGFFAHLRNHPGEFRIPIILDNAGYPCDKSVQEFERNLAIELHYLPPYSPHLNSIERLWKIMQKWFRVINTTKVFRILLTKH